MIQLSRSLHCSPITLEHIPVAQVQGMAADLSEILERERANA